MAFSRSKVLLPGMAIEQVMVVRPFLSCKQMPPPRRFEGDVCRQQKLSYVNEKTTRFEAFFLMRLPKSMAYGIKPGHPATVVCAVIIMFSVSLAAAFFPGRRAANVDPMSALRHD